MRESSHTLIDSERDARRALPIALTIAGSIILGTSIEGFHAGIAFVTPLTVGVLALAALIRFLFPPAEDEDTHRRILRWTYAALALHLVVGLVIFNTGLLYYLGGDSLVYHLAAGQILMKWSDGLPVQAAIGIGREGYYYFIAGIYYVFGAYSVAGITVNAVIAAALVPVTTDLTTRLFGRKAARYVPPMVVLIPGMIQWTSQMLKEASILLLIVVSISCAVRIAERARFAPILTMGVALAGLMTVRGYIGTVLAAALVLSIALGSRRFLAGINTSLAAVLVLAFLVLAVGFGYSGYRLTTDYNLQEANNARLDLATSANSGFDQNADISTTSAAISYLPRGLVSFVLGPFPWQIHGLRQLAVLPDVMCWWLLLPSLVRGLRVGWRRQGRLLLLLVIPAAVLLVLLSLVIGNFGAVARARMQLLILAIPFMALGLQLRAERWTRPTETERLAIPA